MVAGCNDQKLRVRQRALYKRPTKHMARIHKRPVHSLLKRVFLLSVHTGHVDAFLRHVHCSCTPIAAMHTGPMHTIWSYTLYWMLTDLLDARLLLRLGIRAHLNVIVPVYALRVYLAVISRRSLRTLQCKADVCCGPV